MYLCSQKAPTIVSDNIRPNTTNKNTQGRSSGIVGLDCIANQEENQFFREKLTCVYSTSVDILLNLSQQVNSIS